MKVRIEIDTQTFVRFWLVVIGFVLGLYVLYLARAALVILLSAGFLALALSTPVTFLREYIPGRSRIGATAVAFVAVISFLTAFLFLVVPPIAHQTLKIADQAPQLVEQLASQWEGVGSLVERYNLQEQINAAVASAQAEASRWLSGVTSGVISGVGSFFGVLGAIVLVLVLAFLMLVEGPGWMRRGWKLYNDPVRMREHRELATRMHRVVSGYVTGQLTVSGIGALMSGATVFLLSLFIESISAELALPSIAISFVFSLIPMFGATLAGALITLLLLISNLTAAIIFLVFFIVYQQIENNLISPAIQSRYVELSPLAVLVAVTIGLYLFGLAGGIISIPIAGCVKVLVEHYLQYSRRKREESQKPMQKLVKKLQSVGE
ncbi:hypothetical protein CR983_01270 [Candidatus Saccharibacteria bacterium]|nr:MAG: hypothetical protein CR983_01270 [Candidatus Saccharibacteria bacterium]